MTEVEQLRTRLAELEQTTARRARELIALHEISLEINRQTELTPLLQTILEKAAGLLGAHMGGLYLVHPEQEILELVVAHNLPGPFVGTILKWGEGLSGQVAQVGQVLMVPDYQVWEGRAAIYAGAPFRRVVGVPLKIDEKVIGVINITDDQNVGTFAEEDVRLVILFAEQAAIAVEKARLLATVQHDLAERQRAAQVQASLYGISQAIHTAQNLDELYRLIHETVATLMPARNFGIALHETLTNTIHFPYFVDEDSPLTSLPPRRWDNGLIEFVLRTGEPLLGTRAELKRLVEREQLRPKGAPSQCWLGVPLKLQERAVGVLVVQTYQPQEQLTEEHKNILQFISTQIALAIQRKHGDEALRESERRYRDLFDAAHRQAQELTLLDRVRTTVTRELNLSQLFRTVVTAITETFGYTLVGLYLLDGEVLRLQHQVGYTIFLPEIPMTSGVTGRVVRTGQPELVADVFSEPAFLATMGGIISEVCVPLFDAGHPVGVLNIESTGGFRLTEADLRLMVALSEHVSSAISRARLYTEARQNAARLTAVMQSLPFDFWAMDRQGRYVLENSIAARHWGDRIGKNLGQLDVPETVLQHWQANDRRAFAGEVVQGEVTYAIDGEQRHFHEIIAPIWNEGEIQGILGVNVDITDRQRMEAALRAGEARLRLVTANIPVILFALDRAGLLTFAEGQGLEVIGERAEDLIGQSVFDLVPPTPSVMASLQRALAGEMLSMLFELKQRAFEMWLSPLTLPGGELNGVIGVAVDMTERERTAQALRDSEERYRILFESNPHPMWAYDLETLAFLTVNDAAVRHYGYTREEFLHMTIADIRPAEDVPALLENVARTTPGLDRAGVWRHRKKDGTLIEVEITSHTLLLDGRSAKVVLVTDVTERRRTEEALRRAQKMESLGILAGGIAHDFNNLLVAILGQTSLALSQLNADHPARVPIEKAAAASRRAADLTRQLLAYSGRGQFEHRAIALNQLIQDNLHLFEVAVPKHVTLRSDLAEPLPFVMGDAGQLQQIIMNMIINAVEAIGAKAGQVVVRTRWQHLTAEEEVWWQLGDEPLAPGEYVLLGIQDNGLGMDAETLSRIFDPFFSTKFTGRGLGLAAVLGIVRGHGGGLKVASEVNVGTTFEIVLPGGAVEAVEPVFQEALQEVDMTQQFVLVIDDEEPVREAVTDILELEGLTVLTAPDGRAGLDVYRQHQADIRLILLDLSMPGLNGEETLRELRRLDAHVRILLSSGYSHAEVAARFADQREVSFIQKPYDAEQLVREVKRSLAHPPAG